MNSKYQIPKKDSSENLRNILIAFYFFITFFEMYLNGTIGSVVKYYMLATVFILLFFYKQKRIHVHHYVLIAAVVYKFISAIWTPDHYIFKLHSLTLLSMFAMLFAITIGEDKGQSYRYMRDSLWFGSVCCGVLSLFYSEPYLGVSNRLVLTIFNVQNDPNNQAAFLVFGIAISLNQLLYENKHRFLHLAVIAINCYAALLTGSRGGLLSIFAIVIGYALTLYDKETLKANYKKIIVIAFLVLVVGIVVFTYLPTDIFARLFEFETYEGGSNRDTLWRYSLRLLSSPLSFLFGAGWGAYALGHTSLHNTFLSMLCDVGILGFSLFFVPCFKAMGALLKKKELLPCAIFIAGMAPSFFIEAINKRFFWNALIFLFTAYNYLLQEKQEASALMKKNRYIK